MFEITEMQEDGWVEGRFKAKAFSVTKAEQIAEKYMTTKWYEGIDESVTEEANELNIEVHQTDQWTDEGNPEYYEPDVENTQYEVNIGGELVGEMTYDNYFGYLAGNIGNRTVQLEMRYEESAEDCVKRYFATPTGQKHLKVMGFA
jgi:hypothetical protein